VLTIGMRGGMSWETAPSTTGWRAWRCRLRRPGADLLLCINTMHQVAAAVRIPMLHLVEVTAAAARGAGVRTVGLLGAAFTMEQDFYRDRLASHGLTVIVPDAAPSGP